MVAQMANLCAEGTGVPVGRAERSEPRRSGSRHRQALETYGCLEPARSLTAVGLREAWRFLGKAVMSGQFWRSFETWSEIVPGFASLSPAYLNYLHRMGLSAECGQAVCSEASDAL